MRTGDAIIQERITEFRSAYLDLGYSVPESLTAEMALSPSLNAGATYYLRQNRHHIAINAALMLFVRRMARIASLHFPFVEQTAAIVQRDGVAGREFAKLLLEVSGFAQVDPTSNFNLGGSQTELADECERLAQGQVVGHEMAHVCLGHLGLDRGTSLDTAGGRITVDEVAWAQADEVAADFWGMLAQLRWADTHLGTRLALAIWAGDYFMASLGFWEKFEPDVLWPLAEQLRRIALRDGREISFNPPIADTDHPPMDVRRELLRDHLKKALKSDVDNSSELAIAHDMSLRTNDYLAALWQSAKEPFQQGLAESLSKRT